MTLKVEVGKKYQHNVTNSVFTCVALNQTQVVFEGTAGFTTFWWTEMHKFTEYKELEKQVRYYNLYPRGVVIKHADRETADKMGGKTRIGRIRVEFVEGTWDE